MYKVAHDGAEEEESRWNEIESHISLLARPLPLVIRDKMKNNFHFIHRDDFEEPDI